MQNEGAFSEYVKGRVEVEAVARNKELTEAEALKILEPYLNSIRKADIIFKDHAGNEIMTMHVPNCLSGDIITQKVPALSDVHF